MNGLARFGFVVVSLAVASAASLAQTAPDYTAILNAPDRTEADRKNDERRAPVKILAFAGVQPGWTILDMGAGAGYSTELMARAAGPSGKVYGQNPPDMMDRARSAYEERAKSPAMRTVTTLTRVYDDPVPAEVKNLDLITFFYAYHDVTYMPVDRAKMNAKMFAALKPGGFLVIADHSAKQGEGTTVAKTLHRIEEATLRQEIQAAGFKLVAEGDFLHHPEDPRDDKVFKPAVPVDEFILKYQKPN